MKTAAEREQAELRRKQQTGRLSPEAAAVLAKHSREQEIRRTLDALEHTR